MTASPAPASQPDGYGLTIAQILYKVPDFRNLVQEYLWQDYDLSPDFPELKRFLAMWKRTSESALLSVPITHSGLIKPTEFKPSGHFYLLN